MGLSFPWFPEEEELVGVQSTDSAFYTSDGSFLRRFTPNVWQLIRFETDLAEKTVSIKIDGKLCGRFPFSLAEKQAFTGVSVTFAPKKDATLGVFATFLQRKRKSRTIIVLNRKACAIRNTKSVSTCAICGAKDIISAGTELPILKPTRRLSAHMTRATRR